MRLPLSYRSALPADVRAAAEDKLVTGTACNRSLAYLAAWGDGGYIAAVRDALKDDPGAVLYDVRTDRRGQSYLLGLYTRLCTVVTGRVGRP